MPVQDILHKTLRCASHRYREYFSDAAREEWIKVSTVPRLAWKKWNGFLHERCRVTIFARKEGDDSGGTDTVIWSRVVPVVRLPVS